MAAAGGDNGPAGLQSAAPPDVVVVPPDVVVLRRLDRLRQGRQHLDPDRQANAIS